MYHNGIKFTKKIVQHLYR